jgi:hypothetical protein
MTAQEWQTTVTGQLFAVVEGAMDSEVIARFYQHGGADAFPLFAGTPFADNAKQGPWLLPSPSPAWMAASPTLHGCYVVSQAGPEAVRQHWQSLNEVAFDGEVMQLRYADPRILSAILAAMSATERDEMLGPCSDLWVDGRAWQRSPERECVPRVGPWCRLQAHHLASLYDLDRHCYILRRYLWQRLDTVMVRHPNPDHTIKGVLTHANATGLTEEVRDGVVAGALALQMGAPLAVIQAPLLLSADELAHVERWLSSHPELIGAIHGH